MNENKINKHLSYYTFFFFSVLVFELRAYTLSYSTSPFFVMGFFPGKVSELFAWANFEPQSSYLCPLSS
jgi:hypothetical protein